MHPAPKALAWPDAGTTPPTLNAARATEQQGHPEVTPNVGEDRHLNSIMERAGAVVLAMSGARGLSDEELRQHAMDCAWLMEQAYGRFEDFGNPADREESLRWMEQRRVALHSLSPEWKAAREAQIQREIGQDYFLDAADRKTSGRAG